MKAVTQIETLKSIRKPATPATRIIRPKKGGGYRRGDFMKAMREIDQWCDKTFGKEE